MFQVAVAFPMIPIDSSTGDAEIWVVDVSSVEMGIGAGFIPVTAMRELCAVVVCKVKVAIEDREGHVVVSP